MSLCFALQKPNEIYIAGDSRVSVDINNQKLRWHDNYTKVHKIDDKVIFIGGQSEIMVSILNKYKKASNRSVENLRVIAETEYRNNHITNNTGRMIVCMIIAEFIENEPMLYFIGDENNFELMKIELNGKEYNDVLLGCCCDSAHEKFNYSDFKSDDFNDIILAYKNLYDQVTNEEVGGELTIYKLTKDSIEKKSCLLSDPENIRQFQSFLTCSQLFIGNSPVNAIVNNRIDDSHLNIKASTINALNITAKSVSSDWVYAGNINASQITAGTISANRINTSGLSSEKIYKAGSPNNYAIIGGDYCDFKLYNSAGYNYFTVYDGVSGSGALQDNQGTFLSFGGQNARPQGKWDFSDCTEVKGLNSVAVFG
jgi:hypothetical protein